MITSDIPRIEALLLKERARILRSLDDLRSQANDAGFEATGAVSDYPLHLADIGTEAMVREQALALAAQESRYFSRIQGALERLYQDPEHFGRCQSCQQEIPMARMEIVPHTRFCLSCKSQLGEAA
jgi:DnaK suppressor protein